MSDVRLSIVMPCYNVEKTIAMALGSILMQRTDFRYEIIAIDDASTDGTQAIIREYAGKHPQIRLLVNETNLGNAKTFKRGSEASRGDYLCVLDGDDFYTVRDKLQRQVDFLDGDSERKYYGVAHHYLTVNPDGTLREDARLFGGCSEHTFFQFITHNFYCHTSTMMYRNVFRGRKIPILETQRGDTIRTLIAMNASCGKVKVLNFVGSAYTVNPVGIWSSLDAEKRKEIDVSTWKSCARHVESAREKRIIGTIVKKLESAPPQSGNPNAWGHEMVLQYLHGWSGRLAFGERDFIFRKLYKSDFIDSFCESLGFVMKNNHGIEQYDPDDRKIAIVISALNKTGGGIYQEILELVSMLQSRKITIILTDMSDISEFTDEMKIDFAPFKKLSFVFLRDMPQKLVALQNKLAELRAGKIYWYVGHNNVWADAAIQDYGGKNIVPFSFDHGLSLGLANTNVNLFIAKTPKDYRLLSEKLGDRVIYIPCWSVPAETDRKYEACETVNTATAAARFYKYEGNILGSFRYFIISVMKTTGGKHVHYGPLPGGLLESLRKTLKRQGLAPENFVHVPWAPNLPDSMLENGVDLFISPFPITSIKISLQCMSAGIPILAYAGGLTRIEQNDFINPDALTWRDRDDFSDILGSLTREKLSELSASGLEYFRTHNDLAVAMPNVLQDKCFEPVPIPPPFIDDRIIDVDDALDLINFACED